MRKSSRPAKQLSRRHFMTATGGAAIVSAVAGPIYAQAQTPNGNAPLTAEQNLTLVNGRIHTMDARNSIVSSVSIRNGRIVSADNVAPSASPDARVIDLKGATAVPGLIEAHTHTVSLANR